MTPEPSFGLPLRTSHDTLVDGIASILVDEELQIRRQSNAIVIVYGASGVRKGSPYVADRSDRA